MLGRQDDLRWDASRWNMLLLSTKKSSLSNLNWKNLENPHTVENKLGNIKEQHTQNIEYLN